MTNLTVTATPVILILITLAILLLIVYYRKLFFFTVHTENNCIFIDCSHAGKGNSQYGSIEVDDDCELEVRTRLSKGEIQIEAVPLNSDKGSARPVSDIVSGEGVIYYPIYPGSYSVCVTVNKQSSGKMTIHPVRTEREE